MIKLLITILKNNKKFFSQKLIKEIEKRKEIF